MRREFGSRGERKIARALLAIALCAACGGTEDRSLPDVLLITVDTLRADRLGAYGYSRPTSPNMDRLASEGVLFETAYAPVGATSPSHASLFTSRSPVAHGVVRNGLHLPEIEETLAEILRRKGFETAAFVSSYPVSSALGFAQGFEVFDDVFDPSRFAIPRKEWEGHQINGVFDRPGEATIDAAMEWLAARTSVRPLFLWVHLFDPHYPYRPPQEDVVRFAREGQDRAALEKDLYDAEVHYADRQVGRLLSSFDARASGKDSLVILTSDHGEGLGDHGWRSHNRFVYEEEVRVPLLMRWTGHLPPGIRVQQAAQLVDVTASIVAALDLDAGDAILDGRNLLPFARGELPAEAGTPIWLQKPSFQEDARPKGAPREGFGVRVGPWKLIVSSDPDRRELYHLGRDPRESRNLASELRPRADALAGQLAAWRAAESRKRRGRVELPDSRDRRALEALGYVESPTGADQPPSPSQSETASPQ